MSGRDRLLHPGAGHHGVHGPARPAHPLLQILPLLLRLHGQLILNEKEALAASNISFKEFTNVPPVAVLRVGADVRGGPVLDRAAGLPRRLGLRGHQAAVRPPGRRIHPRILPGQ